MEALVYSANCMYLAAYFMRDMLHMRLLSIVAATCLASYFYFRPEPMLTVVGWNLVFIMLNAVQIARLLYRRQTSR
jgi:hypothetical protein